jgi:hypothetical protein
MVPPHDPAHRGGNNNTVMVTEPFRLTKCSKHTIFGGFLALCEVSRHNTPFTTKNFSSERSYDLIIIRHLVN